MYHQIAHPEQKATKKGGAKGCMLKERKERINESRQKFLISRKTNRPAMTFSAHHTITRTMKEETRTQSEREI